MGQIGYVLSSEEHRAPDLIRYAARAEECGFDAALISDHYHPWTDLQGNSAFVWSVIGAISQATERLRLGTGVTCPIIRMHPAIIAQAAATAATLMPSRFFLGVGAGENLNEHILGLRWPPPSTRLQMLEEAVEVIRLLWKGGFQRLEGRFYKLDEARVYNLPSEPPPILLGAGGPVATKLAARVADGIIGTLPDADQIKTFNASGGAQKLRYGKVTVCWAEDAEQALQIARRWFPNAAMGDYALDLRLPKHFEEIAKTLNDDSIASAVICSPDPERHVAAIEEYFGAGYDVVFVHQVGPDQEGFFRFYQRHVLPALQREALQATRG